MAGRPQRRARLAAQAAEEARRVARRSDGVTPRFLQSYRSAGAALVNLVNQEVQHLFEVRASVSGWVGEYERVRIGAANLLEVDLGGGPRLLAHAGPGGDLTILGFGDHGWFNRYTPGQLQRDLATRQPLPSSLTNPKALTFAASGANRSLTVYGNEVRPEWLYFLDKAQTDATEAIVDAVETALISDMTSTQFLLGGPGTGKTSVLLQLLMRLSCAVVDNCETWDVRIDVGDRLTAFIDASTGWDLDAVRAAVSLDNPADVLLVDDPLDTAQIERYAALMSAGALRAMIIGFDPLQLRDSIEDGEYRTLQRKLDAGEHVLNVCYRQKEAVGMAAQQVAHAVAASSPFLIEEKQTNYRTARAHLTQLANAVDFVNPSGRVDVFEDATSDDWAAYVNWIRANPLWDHWATLLVVVEESLELPAPWRERLGHLRYEQVRLDDALAVKGLEYQHVALLLTRSKYAALRDGFSGSGKSLYNDFRLARIPFSRAKDSIATFTIDPSPAQGLRLDTAKKTVVKRSAAKRTAARTTSSATASVQA